MKSINAIRNAIAVIGVTLLVWLFAESESLRPLQASAELVFTNDPSTDRTLDLAGQSPQAPTPSRVRVLVDFEGAAAAIDAAERALRRPLSITPSSDGVPRTAGDHSLNISEIVRTHPDLRGLAITLRKCDPSEVRITVDELTTRTVPVFFDVPQSELDGVPGIRPPSIQVRGPRAAIEKLTETDTVNITLTPEVQATLVRGRKQSLAALPLRAPAALAGVPHVVLTPATADADFTLRAAERTITVATVPVHLRIAPGELSKWEITIPEQDRFLTDVTFTGPPQAVRTIEDKSITVIATVSLSFEELERNITSKEAVIADLPQGVRAGTASAKPIRLTIRARQPAPQ
jgi:hypothetical protein